MSQTNNVGGATGAPNYTSPSARPQRLFTLPLLVGLAGLGALAVLSLLVGVYDVWGAADGRDIFLITRIPRTASLLLAGSVMAMCGLVMQQLTQNRFVEPATTGTTEWAALGLLTSYILLPDASLMVRMVGAIGAAFGGTMLFFAVLQRSKLRSAMIVPIVGIMLGAVVGAVANYLALGANRLQTLGVWFQGSFSAAIKGQYEPLWAVLVVMIGIFLVADRFTIAGLGQDVCTNVGLNYRRVMLLGTGMIAAATGIVTVVIGNLPFVGLIVPNVVSLWRGDNLRSNFPWVAILGAATVTACDIFGRVVIMPFEIPVATILGLVGAIVFVGLLLRRGKGG